MAKEFEIRREVELQATPEQVWDALTTGTGGWLWPMEYEARVGGAAPFGGRVTAWDPPRHLAGRAEGADGWFNVLDHIIEARDGGTVVLRYVHSGILLDDWDTEYDGACQHTDFYLHTLGQYVRYFTGRTATHVDVDGPEAAAGARSFATLKRGLGLADETVEGDSVRLTPPGLDPLDGVVDYLRPHFLGIRTADGLYRFFGRDAFGAPVAVALHLFEDSADQAKTEQAWREWLTRLYA
jgi:uncharacterized protein YndB with AHSA1/START domain